MLVPNSLRAPSQGSARIFDPFLGNGFSDKLLETAHADLRWRAKKGEQEGTGIEQVRGRVPICLCPAHFARCRKATHAISMQFSGTDSQANCPKLRMLTCDGAQKKESRRGQALNKFEGERPFACAQLPSRAVASRRAQFRRISRKRILRQIARNCAC